MNEIPGFGEAPGELTLVAWSWPAQLAPGPRAKKPTLSMKLMPPVEVKASFMKSKYEFSTILPPGHVHFAFKAENFETGSDSRRPQRHQYACSKKRVTRRPIWFILPGHFKCDNDPPESLLLEYGFPTLNFTYLQVLFGSLAAGNIGTNWSLDNSIFRNAHSKDSHFISECLYHDAANCKLDLLVPQLKARELVFGVFLDHYEFILVR
jgi:hypothetical protein